MRILFFINHLANGGAERVAATLLNHLSEQHDVEVVFFSDQKSSYNINPKISIHKILVNSKIKTIRFVRRIIEIKKIIKSHAPDIIISFLTHTNSYVLIANLFQKSTTIVMEQTTIQCWASIWHIFTRRVLYRFATKVVLVSNDDCSYAKWLKNKTCIHNPLSFSINKEPINKEPVIVAIGAQSRWQVKGFDMLIQAWAKIAQTHPNWKLQFIGADDNNHIKNVAISLGIENRIVFSGRTNDTANILRDKSIYVLSSRREGFPCSLLEAMSQGCACVAFDCKTGPNEIITDGQNGLLVRNGDTDDLAQKLQLLIENESLRNELSDNAKDRVKDFDKITFFAKWDNLINEVAKR